MIDFSYPRPGTLACFKEDSYDLDLFFVKLSAIYGRQLYKRESLIIFDEVQLYPPARQLIKHLVADGRYDYLETGSLISLHKNVRQILIPSEEEHIEMFPMDFEEFLWAMGDEATVPFLRGCFERRQALGQELHRKVLNDFRQYLLVGGMPQAVAEFVRSHDLDLVD
jgi:predicted AAA+ superfamily ATPase